MPLLSGAATAASGGSAVGWEAYKYNRTNFIYDAGLRYTRFTTGYSMACEQTSMYREDIRDLTGYTVAKQDLYHVVGVIFYVITLQLIMAGRLGVHGPSPPGWLLGIHYTCGALALMWLTVSTWLAMHASARATSGMAYMLTREVRLPIPSPAQLDKARRYGNEYEQQRVNDMVRVPFVMPAGKVETSQASSSSSKGSKLPQGKAGSSSKAAAAASTRRMPKWYSDEDNSLYERSNGSVTTPAHFELYRGLSQEWWAHDIYARVALLYFMSYWTHGASFYIQCHAFGELRAIWVAWTCTFPFVAAHYGLLKIDIMGEVKSSGRFNYPIEKIAPLTPLLTVLGMSLEYSIIEPSNGLKAVIYIIAWICYFIHFAWALRLCDLAVPETRQERKEFATQPWWPQEWPIPSAFMHAQYLVAPPKQLEDGQTDLLQEMKAYKSEGRKGAVVKARETQPGLFAYRIFRGGLVLMVFAWIVIMIGRLTEQFHGERVFMRPEGRVERWPSHMQPWIPPWTREGQRDYYAHTGGSDRRLGLQQGRPQEEKLADVAQRLSAVLTAVSGSIDAELSIGARTTGAAPPTPRAPLRQAQAKVEWPSHLQPATLACGRDGAVAALTRDGRAGASLRLTGGGRQLGAVDGNANAARPFQLEGVQGLGNLVGTSWSEAGLLLTTSSGAIVECAGQPPVSSDEPWRCAEVAPRLPAGGSTLQWAAAARVPQEAGRLRAAVIFDGDDVFTLLERNPDAGEGLETWEPAGEVRVPASIGRFASLSLSEGADELLISTEDGGVLRWPLGGAVPAVATTPHVGAASADLIWRGTCSLGDGRLAHLASSDAKPAFFISARA
eukprot:TRINITY_DN6603_c0_g1_i1.p1 TRINITY_DN6603_c0_g1~~TRINITY_DN6603_c0_g1_i1.p1  ORF type:complete len:839 (-),score=165.86 TRINITY_DN6603_c0_g1_i1:49-2565(-)